jgi:hypothetical protein
LSGIFSGETGDSSNGDLVAGAKSRRGDVVLPSLRDSMSTNRFPFATPSNFFVIFFSLADVSRSSNLPKVTSTVLSGLLHWRTSFAPHISNPLPHF